MLMATYNPDETLSQEMAREAAIKAKAKPAPQIFSSKRAFNKGVRSKEKSFANKVDVLKRKFEGDFQRR